MAPAVSIITPHFDRPGLLRDMVDSVISQSFSSWELIIVDDQSSDDHFAEIRKLSEHEQIQVLRRERSPKGPSHCRNLGLALARGSFVLFLDSDDLLAPWCLEDRVTVLQDRPELDFAVFPVLLFHSVPGDRNLLWNRLTGGDDLERFLGSTPPWCMTSPLWRSKAVRGIGGLAINLRYGTDSELHTRALLRGLHYEKFPEHLPDMFVRRDETPRFNAERSDALLDAHFARLTTTTRMLVDSKAEPGLFRLWEVQYFAELEFLIFNAPQPGRFTDRLFEDWSALPGSRKSTLPVLRFYAWIASVTRDRCYLVLRLTRKMILRLIPSHLRPDSEDRFHQTSLEEKRFEALQRQLRNASAPSRAEPSEAG